MVARSMLLNRVRYAVSSVRPRLVSRRCPVRIAAPRQALPLAYHFTSSPGTHQNSDGGTQNSDGENQIMDILREKLTPTYIQVRDISGGCGSMFEIVIDSEQFKGKRLLQQHRMVNEALGEDVLKSLHGLTIRIENPQTKS